MEVEFAVNMDVAPGEQQIFNLLQIRPIIDNQDNRPIDWSAVDISLLLFFNELIFLKSIKKEGNFCVTFFFFIKEIYYFIIISI